MSMILEFRMLSDENEHFLRDYELHYKMSLLDFHYFICEDLDYDPDNMASFFTSDTQWSKLQEMTLMDMGDNGEDGAPVPMESIKLSDVIRKSNDRLIYQFDMLEDRSLFIELMGSKKAENNVDYPRVKLANGEAPDQFDPEASPVNRSIFDEAMSDFDEFSGGDEYSDDE